MFKLDSTTGGDNNHLASMREMHVTALELLHVSNRYRYESLFHIRVSTRRGVKEGTAAFTESYYTSGTVRKQET